MDVSQVGFDIVLKVYRRGHSSFYGRELLAHGTIQTAVKQYVEITVLAVLMIHTDVST